MNLSYSNRLYDYSDLDQCRINLEMVAPVLDFMTKYDETLADETLNLETMDDLDAGMRICIILNDMKTLASYMRAQERLIKYGRKAGYESLEFLYFSMEFDRYNALLYHEYKYEDKAQASFDDAVQTLRKACEKLKKQADDDPAETEFLAWSMHEIYQGAMTIADFSMDRSKAARYMFEDVALIEWAEPYLSPGLLVETAEVYGNIGGIYFEQGIADRGREMYQKSIDLYDQLEAEIPSEHLMAQGLFMKSKYVTSTAAIGGDPNFAGQTLGECESVLQGPFDEEKNRAIVLGASGSVKAYACTVMQGDDARRYGMQAVDELKEALSIMQRYDDDQSTADGIWYHRVVTQVYMMCIKALYVMGNYYVSNNQVKAAEEWFGECLKYINGDPYGLSPAALLIFEANAYENMAIAAAERGSAEESVFYAQQCLSKTEDVYRSVNNPIMLLSRIISEMQLCEIYLRYKKDKPQAKIMARKGLDDCAYAKEQGQIIEAAAEVEKQLKKFMRKASGRLF